MLVLLLTLAAGGSVSYMAWCLICLERNYQRALSMGIPVVRVPVDTLNMAWQVLENPIFSILDKLPFSYGSLGRFGRRGWQFADKARSFLEYGPVWAYATPQDIHMVVAHPEAIDDILTRRHDFIRPVKMYRLLELYGPCISTVGPADWQRHRKVVATPFNESAMKYVWEQSLSQADELVRVWTDSSKTSGHVPSIAKDTRTLSLNVLAAVGFKKTYKFKSSDEASVGNDDSVLEGPDAYRAALQTVLDNAMILMIFPYQYLIKSFWPESWQRLGRAGAAFRQHMERMLEEEKMLLAAGKEGRGGIMTSFVRALGTHTKDSSSMKRGLSVEEIIGNMFVINFAGHDTTANTLAFAMVLLAANPDVQEWVAEEIRAVTGSALLESSYAHIFPRLKRCRSLILETLRLYPSVLTISKWTTDQPQPLTWGGRTIMIPPQTGISPVAIGVQTHPEVWGPDPLVWRPNRWIVQSNPRISSTGNVFDNESVLKPAPGSFIPWSDGPQNCPGEKFSQVEFVAFIATLFDKHRIHIVRQSAGESWDSARNRALHTANDISFEMLLKMRDADRVRLECKPVQQ